MRGKTGRGAGRGWASLRDGVGDGDDDYDGVGDDEQCSLNMLQVSQWGQS